MKQKQTIRKQTILFIVLLLLSIFTVSVSRKAYVNEDGHVRESVTFNIGGGFSLLHSSNHIQFTTANGLTTDLAGGEYKNMTNEAVPRVVPTILSAIGVISSLVFFVLLICFFFRLSKGKVFDLTNVRQLSYMGWSLLGTFAASFLLWLCVTIVFFKYNHAGMLEAGYYISLYIIPPLGTLLLALFFFIMSQAFSLGYDLKDEQDHTV